MKTPNSFGRFVSSSGTIGFMLAFVCVIFINVSFVVGYIIGTSTGKSYDDKFILSINPYHILGCALGLVLGWLFKGFLTGF